MVTHLLRRKQIAMVVRVDEEARTAAVLLQPQQAVLSVIQQQEVQRQTRPGCHLSKQVGSLAADLPWMLPVRANRKMSNRPALVATCPSACMSVGAGLQHGICVNHHSYGIWHDTAPVPPISPAWQYVSCQAEHPSLHFLLWIAQHQCSNGICMTGH